MQYRIPRTTYYPSIPSFLTSVAEDLCRTKNATQQRKFINSRLLEGAGAKIGQQLLLKKAVEVAVIFRPFDSNYLPNDEWSRVVTRVNPARKNGGTVLEYPLAVLKQNLPSNVQLPPDMRLEFDSRAEWYFAAEQGVGPDQIGDVFDFECTFINSDCNSTNSTRIGICFEFGGSKVYSIRCNLCQPSNS